MGINAFSLRWYSDFIVKDVVEQQVMAQRPSSAAAHEESTTFGSKIGLEIVRFSPRRSSPLQRIVGWR
jgi:hypothetical protein